MMNRARRTNDARDVSRAMDDARGESDGESESESDSEGSRAGEAREWMPRYRLDSDVVERLWPYHSASGSSIRIPIAVIRTASSWRNFRDG